MDAGIGIRSRRLGARNWRFEVGFRRGGGASAAPTGHLFRLHSVPVNLIGEGELGERGRREEWALGDDGFAWGFVPLAVVVDVAVNAGGADDGFGGDADGAAVFEDGLEGVAEIAAAKIIEAESAGMAVEGFGVVKIVFADDGGGADPVDEIVFDEIAVGMMADEAFAGVAFGVGRGIGVDGRGGRGESGIGRNRKGRRLGKALPFAHWCTPQAVRICAEPV